MKFQLQEDRFGNLIARQTDIPVLRYFIGVPLLLWGGLMLYGVFSSFIIQMQDKGVGGIGEALLGSLVLLLFTGLVLPLGWWLTLASHWKVLEAGTRDIVEVNDWKIGHKEKRTAVDVFRAVRVAMEPLNSSPTAGNRSSVTYCQQIRLLAKDPGRQPSIEIGSLEKNQREQAIAFGQQVADFLLLKLEVAPADALLYSPAREAADVFESGEEDS